MGELDEERIRSRCGASNWQHFLRTASTAAHLAESAGLDVEKARLAGLLHDYARSEPRERLVEMAEERGIAVNEVERQTPYLLHGPVGASLVEEELNVHDEELLQAIRYHTIGRPGMSPLEKIVYLADMIEPARSFPGVEEIRAAAARSLDEAFKLAYRRSLEHLLESGKPLHPATVDVWNWLNAERKR
ncbi:MAG: HD domain-containing protein [Actinobacteria bacterium]|nr:MAG: HD domain-containing protein [Actinomycetota bacterium]